MSDSVREPGAPEPARSFEQARALAKRLLKDCRAGDATALERVRARLPQLAATTPAAAAAAVKLADVQHALAREAGVANWAELKRAYEAAEPLAAQLRRFVGAWHSEDAATMRHVLETHPEVARASIHTACGACDEGLVRAFLERDPALATTPFAGTSWTPIVALAASPLFATSPAHAEASVAIGRRLLDAGADANASVPQPGSDHIRLPVLYFAGRCGNAPLARLLLERGARPDDGESAYHAAERDHRGVLEALRDHGADFSAAHATWSNTVLYYLMWHREPSAIATTADAGACWLLEHGADPNVPSGDGRETPLHRAAEFGRNEEIVRALLDHGADPDAKRGDGRTPLDLAIRSGRPALVELLRERGAAGAARPADALLGACMRGDLAGARAVLDAHPGLLDSLDAHDRRAPLHAAEQGRPEAIAVFAALGFDLSVHGHGRSTALHQAAWRGHADAVRALLAAGVAVDPREDTYGSTPLAWAAHGSANCRDADDDYVAVVDLLLDAGAARAPSFNHWNEPPEALCSDAVEERLRARGFVPKD
ncbi:MAG: ankyrin repeat domain-containing protein [Candidatus Eisenbacteria bacterium]|uniref:Ankyrin repeat domain-containing protein n=1 Tax=Eiseniibacteriota bacterium TaxID=2212470 RepID=A0A933SCN2_UNCEI|nr:ankyrin repeat domain-containing protein [Candidatus Eisenbacteria bacterium]